MSPSTDPQMPARDDQSFTSDVLIPEDELAFDGADSTGMPLIRDLFKDAALDNSAPEELQVLFASHGLGDITYQCMLKQKHAGAANQSVIKGYNNEYPSLDYITKNYGPGDYVLVFMWRRKMPGEKKLKTFSEKIDISISEKTRDIYTEYQFRQRLERMKKNREAVSQAKLEKIMELEADTINGFAEPSHQQPVDITKEAKKQLESTMEFARQMGLVPLSHVSQPPAPKNELWDKLLPVLIPSIPALIKLIVDAQASREEKSRENMLLMIELMKSSNTQMLEMVKANQGPSTGQQMMKEFGDMVKNALNVKELFEGQKEGLADKVFRLIESVAPHILPVLAMGPAQRQFDPRWMIAQQYASNAPEIQQLRDNPLELKKLVQNLDETIGWEQTDQILTLMTKGVLTRPDDCPRRAEQQFPAGTTPQQEEEENQ